MSPRGKILRTDRQRSVMKIIIEAASAGENISVKEIHKRLGPVCAYGTVRTCLRHLLRHKMVYYETDPPVNYYRPTLKGLAWFKEARF